jgi:curved DNA-binding protein CbpA
MSDNPKDSVLQEIEPDFTSTDPYRILGVLHTATQLEIKRSYFALIRQFPPETEGERFKIVRAAYEKIKDSERRTETDIFLPQQPPPWEHSGTLPEFDSRFQIQDVLLVLRRWGDLGRRNFQDDFKEIEL